MPTSSETLKWEMMAGIKLEGADEAKAAKGSLRQQRNSVEVE